MRGERAVPAVDAAELVAEIPQLAAFSELRTETAMGVPGTHLSLAPALEVANRACTAAGQGEGVVITTGTDTLEELAMLCALMYDGEAHSRSRAITARARGPGGGTMMRG